MSGMVPFTFPLSVTQGEQENYRQEVDEDATIERVVVFFPKGTASDLQLTLTAAGETVTRSQATNGSEEIPDYIIGSGTTYQFDLSVRVFEGQEIGVTAENVSNSSDLDAFVAYSLDYNGGNR